MSIRGSLLAGLAVGSLFGAAALGGTANRAPQVSTSDYLDVSGAKIYYEQSGSGAAVVLLHDGLLPSTTWDEVWEALASRHRVIRYDRRGCGRSEMPSKPYSSTKDLKKLLTHLKVEHAVVVGSSSGAALAIDFAIEHPEMVDGLFLIGPVLNGMEFTKQFRERARHNNEPMERGDVKAWARNWSQDKFLIAGANDKARRKVYEQLVANAEKLKKFDSALEEKISPPASKRLSEVKTPTLILVGDADIGDVRAHCDAIKAGLGDSEQFVVKGAGHLVQIEKPGDVIERLEDFAGKCQRK